MHISVGKYITHLQAFAGFDIISNCAMHDYGLLKITWLSLIAFVIFLRMFVPNRCNVSFSL